MHANVSGRVYRLAAIAAIRKGRGGRGRGKKADSPLNDIINRQSVNGALIYLRANRDRDRRMAEWRIADADASEHSSFLIPPSLRSDNHPANDRLMLFPEEKTTKPVSKGCRMGGSTAGRANYRGAGRSRGAFGVMALFSGFLLFNADDESTWLRVKTFQPDGNRTRMPNGMK